MNTIITNQSDCGNDKLSTEEKHFYTYSYTDFDAWEIDWNAKEISNGQTGYILQHIKLASEIEGLSSDDYYEAWRLEKNCVEQSEEQHDDKWSPGFITWFTDAAKEKVRNSNSALVMYDAEVYWVPIDNDAYEEIEGWKPYGAPEAGDLKSSKKINTDVKAHLIAERHRGWDYKAILKTTNSEMN